MTAAVVPIERARVTEDAEQAVLGAVLIEPNVFGVVADLLEAADFAGGRHRLIFAAARRLDERAEAIDPVTLAVELERQGDLKVAGGQEYLSELLFAVPTAANVEYHARIVKEKALRRRLAKVGQDVAGLAHDAAVPSSVLLANLRTELETIERAQSSTSSAPKWWVLADLLNDPTLTAAPVAVLPPIGWQGRVTLVAGREKKGGKSFACCAGVASATRQGKRALYLSLDEPLADTVGRLHRFGADPTRVYIMTARPADLGAVVKELAVDVVVIDALSHYVAHDAPESGDAAAWTRVMMPIVAVARSCQVAVIVTQHASKGTGEYRDSTAIGANADVILTMTEQPDGSRKATALARFSVPGFTVRLEGDGGATFDVDDGTAPPDRGPAPALVQLQVLRLLQSAEPDGLKTNAWQRLANEAHISRTSFFRARRALFTAGHASHQSTIYRVSPSGARWLASERAE